MTAAEGVAQLEVGRIDVVLADVNLPEGETLKFCAHLREHSSQVPVVIIRNATDNFVSQTVEDDAQDYLLRTELSGPLLAHSIRHAVKRAETERRLALERNLLRSVVDTIPDSIYVKDAEGRYILDNVAHRAQLGAGSFEEVVGRTVFDFFSQAVARRFQADDERVMQSGVPILHRHEAAGDADNPERWLSTTKVPLRDPEGRIIGIVGLGRDITARKAAEARLALYTRELQEKNEQLQDDLNMAREVQQAFLPQQFPDIPRHAHAGGSALRFHAKYLPAATLGGDFFHIFPVSDTQAGVFICDVMGHGVRAALVTAVQRTLVEQLSELAGDPGAFLEKMNASLVGLLRRTRMPMFVSAFYLVVDVANGTMSYANAGHPRPLHLRRSTGKVELLAGGAGLGGPALGVFDDAIFPTYPCALAADDLVILYTDGLYEVEGPRGDFFDQSMLYELVERRWRQPAEQLFEEVLNEVQRFCPQVGFVDDVCLVGIEVQHVGGADAVTRDETLTGSISTAI
jgi:phosphoserine phosphatase RsbU/P